MNKLKKKLKLIENFKMLGGIIMANLNELELQNLRHLIGAHCTIEKKLECYSEQCTDPTLKNMLKKDAQDAKNSKEKLMSFLG